MQQWLWLTKLKNEVYEDASLYYLWLKVTIRTEFNEYWNEEMFNRNDLWISTKMCEQ